MRIAFNAVSLNSQTSGIGRYSRQLLEQYEFLNGILVDKFYGIHWASDIRRPAESGSINYQALLRDFVPYSYFFKRIYFQHFFSQQTKKNKYDVYHEPNYLTYDFDGRVVLTVHDLSWINYPSMHPKSRLKEFDRYFEKSLDRANYVITDSNYIKNELIEAFGLESKKIQAIPLGVSANFRPVNEVESIELLAKYNLHYGKYFLAVGTIEPRKNLKVVLHAFQKIPKKIRKNNPLVIVGKKGWMHHQFFSEIEPYVRSGEVRLLGHLPEDQLVQVISSALCMIYPSVYEGFGLPPLEAMACGTPVITSNSSSIPEVVGAAGFMCEADDVSGFSDAMRLILESEDARSNLSLLGLQRSREFTWSKCAHQTIDVYKRASESK